MNPLKWYRDAQLLERLPARYRAYAAYCRLAGDENSRRIPGGSFLLRALKTMSRATGLNTLVQLAGRDGLTVLADMADERILDVIHEIRGENPEHKILLALLSRGDTFIDVGANYGTFALLSSRIVGAEGRVFAIEPQSDLAGLIAESLRLSKVENCVVVNRACGNSSGEFTLIVPADDRGRAGFFPEFSARHDYSVHPVYVSSLDDLMSDAHLTGRVVIKIDVEGSEADVLSGAAAIISRHDPVILIELNPWSASAAGKSTDAVVNQLIEYGYTSFSLAQQFPATTGRHSIPRDRQVNLIARK